MQTGDIILFSDTHFLPSRIIEFSSHSIYSHVGIIVKDCLGLPTSTSPSSGDVGVYILESTGFSDIPDAEDNKIKWGVQIRPFDKVKDEYNGSVFHRSLHCDRNDVFYKNLEEAYSLVKDATYNTSPVEWLSLLLGKDLFHENGSSSPHGDVASLVCSTLVAFIYQKLDLISNHCDYALVRPKDLGTEIDSAGDQRIKFKNCIVEKEVQIK
jgi:hypothetical protein